MAVNLSATNRQTTTDHRMTGNYTHTRPETQRQQIEQALRKWPVSLRYAMERISGK
jgi:hypothetical protein